MIQTRIFVPLGPDALITLDTLARRDRRTPKDIAKLLLTDELARRQRDLDHEENHAEPTATAPA